MGHSGAPSTPIVSSNQSPNRPARTASRPHLLPTRRHGRTRNVSAHRTRGVRRRAILPLVLGAAVALLWVSPGSADRSSRTAALPQPSSENRLAGVSCITALNCWAVGSAQDSDNHVTAEIFRWDGSAWTAISSPVPKAGLDGLSCSSRASCWAIG